MDKACISPADLTDCSNCRDLCLGPVIFPCGHLICRRCVRQLIARKGLLAHCSSCHQIIPLVQGETISDIIDNMCKDLVIEKMVCERLRQNRKASCDLCHETKVTNVCLDCRHYLCNTCSSVHSVSGHKQQILPTTWTTAEIQSQSDSIGLEALCQERCQAAEEIIAGTQTTRCAVKKILYDQICQLKNSEKNVDKLITTLHNVKVRLTIKQQILGMYVAEIAKDDQSLVQTEPFLNRVRHIKKDNIWLFTYLAAVEGCFRALRHCGYMTSEHPNTPQVNVDEAREGIVVEQMVKINIQKTECNQVTSQTAEQSPLTLKGVDCIKIAGRSTAVNTHSGTILVETITDPNVLQGAENIVVAKTDWSNDRIQNLESERREMTTLKEKNKSEMMKLEKNNIKVTGQPEEERKRLKQQTEEERSRATEQTPIDGQGQTHQKTAEKYWLQCIHKWYPHLQSQTYFLPPFHFNRVPYCVENIAGKQVLVPQTQQSLSAGRRNQSILTFLPVSVSEVRDDRALQRVLHGMRSLADNGQQKEVMFVVSQLQFDNYLGEPGFAPAPAILPRPSTLPEHFRQQHYDKGDFDVLIIHRKHGLFILEINSVGENFGLRKMSNKQEDVLKETVEVVTKQLNKAEVVLRHLTSDLKPKINITKSLVMPNIKSSQLRAIMKHSSAGKVLCQCLGVRNVDDAVKLCLLSDQLSDNQMSLKINKSFLQDLRLWWQHVVRASGTKPLMTSALYEQLLARFCGPATTMEVPSDTAPRLNIRTLGEAVSETGERVARLVLFPQQVDILNRSPPRTFLSGPPGTGKTILLIMQGLNWLQRGHDVHVVSTCDESRAVTIVIEHQLQERAKTSTARSRVHRHQFDFEKDGEVKIAVRRLKSLSEGRQLCVIADEVVYYRELFTKFCDQLIKHVPGVFIWGASVHHDVRPLCQEEVKLTTPLRSPPVVVREVMESWLIKDKQVHDYTVSDVPVPTEGPPVMRFKHHDGHSDHTGHWQHDCVECGHEVARVLTELDVGQTGDSNSPPPLKYSDVLVMCLGHPTDDRVDSNGQVSTMAIGLVRGLRDRDVPVRVVEEGDEAAIRDTALGVGDEVTVANWCDVLGLERKVVVVETETGASDLLGRLHAMSRCTSQLVVIDW